MMSVQETIAMNTFARTAACLVLGLALTTEGPAALIELPRGPEISGTYDDEGTVAIPAPEGVKIYASLHAFLSGEFSEGMSRLIHEKTGQVRLQLEKGRLEAEVTDHDGESAWRMEWKSGETYGVQKERVVILFKGTTVNDDQYRLILESVSTYKLLQVEVQRLTPSTFGLQVKPLGTYLFSRAE
jgi:hypothetical protein